MIPGKLHPMVPVQWYFGAIGLYFPFLHTSFRGRGMVSAMLLSISIVALSQFALYYWRAVLAGVAAQPVSDRVLVAAQVENGRLTPKHFPTLAGLHDLTPDLYPNHSGLSEASTRSLARRFLRWPPGARASASSAPATPPSRWIAACRPTSTSRPRCAPADSAATLTRNNLNLVPRPLIRPAQQHAPRRVPRAHGDNQHQVALVQAALFHGVAQPQGNRPCRRVPIPVDVHHHFGIFHAQALLHRSNNAQVGLMGHQQLQIVLCEAIFLE